MIIIELCIDDEGDVGLFIVSEEEGTATVVWLAVDGELYFLGRYKDFFEACCSRKSAENIHNFTGE